jgi:hypothetical protein
MISLSGILLEGLPEEHLHTRSRNTKKFLLVKFDVSLGGGGVDDICRGLIGRGASFCTKKLCHCHYTSHDIKVWDAWPTEPGMYIHDSATMRA